jgi:hypothetical protein
VHWKRRWAQISPSGHLRIFKIDPKAKSHVRPRVPILELPLDK